MADWDRYFRYQSHREIHTPPYCVVLCCMLKKTCVLGAAAAMGTVATASSIPTPPFSASPSLHLRTYTGYSHVPFFLPSHRTPIAVNGTLPLPSKGVLLPFMQSGWGFCSNGSGRRGGRRIGTVLLPVPFCYHTRMCGIVQRRGFFVIRALIWTPVDIFSPPSPYATLQDMPHGFIHVQYFWARINRTIWAYCTYVHCTWDEHTHCVAWAECARKSSDTPLSGGAVLIRAPPPVPTQVCACNETREGGKKEECERGKEERTWDGVFLSLPMLRDCCYSLFVRCLCCNGPFPYGKGKGRDFTA